MPVYRDEDLRDDHHHELSARYGLSPRTTHLLPQNCPPAPVTHDQENKYDFTKYDPVKFHQGIAAMANHLGGSSSSNFSSSHRSTVTSSNYVFWRRYAAVLLKNGVKTFAKVVIQEELDAWAKRRGFIILKQYRTYNVNEKMEKTEFARRAK